MAGFGTATDLSGEQFGEWTVLDRAYHVAARAAYWNCLCSCGHRQPVRGTNLRSGTSQRCRPCADALHRADLAGMRFGGWLVLAPAAMAPPNKPRWQCRCDCGAVRLVRTESLVNNRSRRCPSCSALRRAT